MIRRAAGLVTFTAVCLLLASSASAQMLEERSMLPLIHSEATFFVEYRGWDAIEPEIADTNFGRVWNDEAFAQMVADSREQMLLMIASEGRVGGDEEELAGLFLDAYGPFWHKPSAVYAIGSSAGRSPTAVMTTLADARQPESQRAWTRLYELKNQVADEWRQSVPVDVQIGGLQWNGMAYQYGQYDMHGNPQPDIDPQAGQNAESLRELDSFEMFHWEGPCLSFVSDVTAAERAADVLRGRDLGWLDSESARRTFDATAVETWAIHWFLNVPAALAPAEEVDPDAYMPHVHANRAIQAALEPLQIEALGGTVGFADGVSTARTLITTAGPAREIFPAEQSYDDAMSLLPRGAQLAVAGRVTPDTLVRVVQEMMTAFNTSLEGQWQVPKEVQQSLQQLRGLAECCDGRVAFSLTDVQAMMGGAPPMALTLGLRDADAAGAMIEEIVSAGADDEQAGAAESSYREIAINRGPSGDECWAILEDRLILAASESAAKACIDAALGDAHGLGEDHPARELLELAGDGQLMYMIDVPALVRLGWPMLEQQVAGEPEYFPLRSLPSTNHMVELFSPEVGVLRVAGQGLMLESRGTVPGGLALPSMWTLPSMTWRVANMMQQAQMEAEAQQFGP